MNLTATTTPSSGRTDTRPPSQRSRIGLALLAATLLSAAACGTESATGDNSDPTTTATIAASTAKTSTTTSAPTTSAPTTSATTSAASTTSVAAPTTTVPAVARPTETVDQLVGAVGARAHVRCIGQGDATVLMIAGFGGDSAIWAKIEPAITAQARACSYDRPGTGTSDPASSTSTFTTQATELHALLQTIGEPGPYVMVGHSFGGAEAVTFASQYPDEVNGLVLVDASPTTWPAAVCSVPDDNSGAAAMLRSICIGTFPPTGNSEQLDVVPAFAEAAQIVTLDSLPIAVITATRRELPADLAVSEVDRLNDAWNQGQQNWIALSTAAHLVTVDHTGHHIEIDQPGVVINAITHLLP